MARILNFKSVYMMSSTFLLIFCFIFFILLIFCFIFFTNLDAAAEKQHSNLPSKVGLLENEKLTHLHFYFHDIVSGPNATVVQVTSGASKTKSATGFGDVFIIDDPLTEGPESNSKLIGRAQGMYGSASLNKLGLLMNINFCFMEGEYNGSTISVLGRNMVSSEIREMSVVGGTGIFRFGRGYAQAKTHSIDPTTAIVEYNVFVVHY